ncbi:MAG TPA: LacI family DNA-binding transcriptional regulator [Candidatus Excrementavichristensenella intestinipullorum]|nr:LacI family DNA-binding transcriptional regulator [Candidatus Excrementavichristensenella intestinipullorum]
MTIKEIARIAGVSRGTVDRVLNNRGGVNSDTAQRIRQIAQSTHYVPNLAGKNLAAKKKRLRFAYIILTYVDIERQPLLPSGVLEEKLHLSEYGVEVQVINCPLNDVSTMVRTLDALGSEGINGVVLVPFFHPSVAEKMRQLTQAGIPIVTYGSDLEDTGRLAYVGINHRTSGETAARIIRLMTRGPAQIALITSDDIMLQSRQLRVQGFEKELARSYPDITLAEKLTLHNDDFVCYSATKSLLARRDLDAIFINATGIRGVCRALEEHPTHIPSVLYSDEAQAAPHMKKGTVDVLINRNSNKYGDIPLTTLYRYCALNIAPERDKIYTDIDIRVLDNLSPHFIT